MSDVTVDVAVGAQIASAVASVTVEGGTILHPWLEVALGPGSLQGARRIVVPDASQYPVAGVDLWKDGVFNRNDSSGRNEDSEFHFWPLVSLTGGELLEARWVDGAGVDHYSAYSVPGGDPDPDPPPDPDPDPDPPNSVEPVWPTPATTGVLSDGIRTPYTSYDQLTVVNDDFTTTANGEVVEGLDIRGRLNIEHNDVTVRYCRVLSDSNTGIMNDPSGDDNTGLLIHDVEIDMINSNEGTNTLPSAMQSKGGVTLGQGPVLRRVWTRNSFQGVVSYHEITIEDSLLTIERASTVNVDPHREPFLGRGNPITLRRTVFRASDSTGGVSAALALYNAPAGVQMKDAIVEECLIDIDLAEAYCTYPAYLGDTHDGVNPVPTNMTVDDCWFSRGRDDGSFTYYFGSTADDANSQMLNPRVWVSTGAGTSDGYLTHGDPVPSSGFTPTS